MDRDGLFLEVPLLPAGEDGIAQAEKLAGIPLRPKLRGPVPAGVIPGVPGGAFVSATGGDPAEALHAAYAQAKRQETEQEREAAARLVEWDKLQTWIGSAVRHWFAAMPAEPGTPGGGSGGAIYNDGNTMTLNLCGTRIEYNSVNAYGAAIFFVTNDHSGNIVINDSVIQNNIGGSWYPQPGISMHDDTQFEANNSTITHP